MSALGEAALRYAELGYKVFPILPGDKNPKTPKGFHDATVDPDQIEAWWHLNPSANIGIPAAGMLVLDVDLLDDGSPNRWHADEPEKLLDLAAAPINTTPSGGRHFIFRRPPDKTWHISAGMLAKHVDVRTDGGYFIAPPSARPDGRYRWAPDAELDVPPDRLPEPPAWLVEEVDRLATSSPTSPRDAAGGDGSNPIPEGQRNATLASLGGTMRRVGMSEAEISAALNRVNEDRCSPPLPAKEVAQIASSVARYEPDGVATAVVEDHYAQMYAAPKGDSPPEAIDPGPLPEQLLRVPGFISEVMDYCLETAPYPNVAMSFCGALALQAFLAGRKVRDAADVRTNLYLLGLAHSAAGKDHPRKLNTRIAYQLGLTSGVGDRFASGEGIQDALFTTPSMLFQTDEIDGMLQSINKAKDARHEAIMGTLLSMYSAANSVFPMRRKAGKDPPGAIDQPSLILFGTAIPNHYYEALSERMLTNGFFARMIILESGLRSAGQEPRIIDVPRRVLETARWWVNYEPGDGNLQTWHPVPTVIEYSDDARQALAACRACAEAEYTAAEQRRDAVGTTVWGRASEQIRKLALIHAVSQDHRVPSVNLPAVEWAGAFVAHQTRRMLFMAQNHAAANPFHSDCLRLMRKLREAPERTMQHSLLLKRMKVDAQTFQHMIATLNQQGDIETISVKTPGRTGLSYRLVER
jgi:Bifunctional DNA primase/polymerase, N-terminal/Primase C terminal 1 (PriCT-1)